MASGKKHPKPAQLEAFDGSGLSDARLIQRAAGELEEVLRRR